MGKSLLVLLLLLATAVIAQPYKPLLAEHNEWHLTSCDYGCFTDVYYTAGDTIVNGKNHKILDGYHYISRSFLLREDISERKVYVTLSSFRNEEHLLYDFSMQVGDSIDIKNPITPFPYDGGFYKLDSIVSRPLLYGEYHRYFYLSPSLGNTISTNSAVWIEGIGSLSMITAPGGDPNVDGAGLLSCSFRNGQLQYADYDIVEECIPQILNVTKNRYKTLQLLRRENNKFLLIHANRIKRLHVLNAQGRRIMEIKNRNDSIELDLSGYPSGIYLVLAESESGIREVLRIINSN